jgi:hypothetical protein
MRAQTSTLCRFAGTLFALLVAGGSPALAGRRQLATRDEAATALTLDLRAARPDEFVPSDHWLYDALTVWAQNDLFRGFPHQTLSGKPVLTRGFAAESTGKVLGRLAEAGRLDDLVPATAHEFILGSATRATNELAPELRIMGFTADSLADRLGSLARFRSRTNGRGTVLHGMAPCTPPGPPGPQPDRPAPNNHWAYDCITHVAAAGIPTGFPDGTFNGKREQPRGAFAAAILTLLAQMDRLETIGAPWRPHRGFCPLRKVYQEFQAEVLAKVPDRALLGARLERMDALWQDPSPRGARMPVPDVERQDAAASPLYHRPDAEGRGERLAAAEWARGEIVLFTTDDVPPGAARFAAAVPLRHIAADRDPTYAHQLVQAHNRSLWRRLRVGGAPGASPSAWLSSIFNLRRAWRDSTPVAWPEHQDTFSSPDGLLRLRWRDAPDADGWIEVHSPLGEGTLHVPERPQEMVWGPSGTAVVFFRFAAGPDSLYYAVDLRTGWILNADATRGWGKHRPLPVPSV